MPTVSKTSPLIWLSKIGKLKLLKQLFGEIVVPEEVYGEAVEKGLEEGSGDALVIKEAVEQAWIRISTLDKEDREFTEKITKYSPEIHLGEAQAIALSCRTQALLLMDESCGRAFAQTWGLKVRGTLYIITRALKQGLLTNQEAKDSVLELISRGFRIEPKQLARILREIEHFKPQ